MKSKPRTPHSTHSKAHALGRSLTCIFGKDLEGGLSWHCVMPATWFRLGDNLLLLLVVLPGSLACSSARSEGLRLQHHENTLCLYCFAMLFLRRC